MSEFTVSFRKPATNGSNVIRVLLVSGTDVTEVIVSERSHSFHITGVDVYNKIVLVAACYRVEPGQF